MCVIIFFKMFSVHLAPARGAPILMLCLWFSCFWKNSVLFTKSPRWAVLTFYTGCHKREYPDNPRMWPFPSQLYKNKGSSTSATSSSDSRQYYLRFLFNGKDLTHKISFCRRAGFRLSDSVFLCPIETVVRFLHEDYFTAFNTTNFKDACTRG